MTPSVVLARLPHMLADVVREALAPDTGLRVRRADPAAAETLAAAVQRHAPDVVIFSDEEETGEPAALLRTHPGLILLGLSADARHGWVCQLLPRSTPLPEVSLHGLRDTVRAALRERAEWSGR